MSNQKNICCRVFKEQFELIRQLPESERGYVLYQALNNAFNQFENQNDNQIEIQNENAYISVSVSISELGKCILNLLSKNIVCKEFSSNYGGARTGAGRKSVNQIENPNGVNQHSKVGQSDQIRSKLVNSGQILSETETETEEETEIKEKEISNDIPKKKITAYSELVIKTYGENKKVRLTDEQYAKLQELYGRRLENAIQILDGYLAESTKNEKKYTNHYAVMRRNNWVYNKTFDGDFVPLKPQIADMSNFVRAKPLGDEE